MPVKLVRVNACATENLPGNVFPMDATATAAKYFRLSAIHFAKAAQGGDRASYYTKLAQGELARAQATEAGE